MTFEIGDISTSDLPALLELNESEVPHLGRVNLTQMQWFVANAAYFRVAKSAGDIAAFLIGMRPGTDYQSLNYRWFCNRYQDFAYVDRIAVAADFRRKGLASSLYEDFAASVPESVRFMTCEVNIKPPNAESMRFHSRLGFEQVGTQLTEHGAKEVALLAKPLQAD
jgi:predicted GNAT superfamily acetyltransferase